MAGEGILGRGFRAIRGQAEGEEKSSVELRDLPVEMIDPNPQQPREVFDPAALAELEASVAAEGVLQPVVVRRKGDRYELIMGERRLRAAMNAGRRTIPAIVRDVPDERLLEISLIENIQRADLNPIEKARAMKNMAERLGITQEEVARRLGIARASVANLMRLLDLPEEVQDYVSRGTLSMGHARAILAEKDPQRRIELARRVIAEGLSVRKTEMLASRAASSKVVTDRTGRRDPNVADLEDRLSRSLGTRVEIRGSAKKGKVVIHYYSAEELEEIIERLR